MSETPREPFTIALEPSEAWAIVHRSGKPTTRENQSLIFPAELDADLLLQSGLRPEHYEVQRVVVVPFAMWKKLTASAAAEKEARPPHDG